MKIIVLLLSASLFCNNNITAQKPALITVKAGSNIMDVLTATDIFHYAQFTDGVIYYRDGTASGGKLNYNFLLGEMQFTNPKGDTLSLANEKDIQLITINKDSFYYDHGYLELVTGNGAVKLAQKQMFKFVDKKKIGGYDQASSSSAIESYTTYNSGSNQYNLNVKEDIVLMKAKDYYLGDKYNHFQRVSKKNVERMFPKQENAIQTYFKENTVHFNQQEDMEKLTAFLQHLQD